MWGFGKSERMPAPAPKVELDELTETSPEVLAMLRARAQAAAEKMKDEMGPVDDALIKNAAFFVALAAEHRGEPYTVEQLENDEQIEGLMARALKAREEVRSVVGNEAIIDEKNDTVLGTAKP